MSFDKLLIRAPLLALALFLAGALQGQEEVNSWTMDFPLNPTQTLPSWLGTPTSAEFSTFGVVHFPIRPRAEEDLAVTVYFDETETGFLRLYWTSSQAAEMISQNLFEGTAMANSRTVVLRRNSMAVPGILSIQTSGSQIPVKRIRWEWAKEATVLVSQDVDVPALLLSDGEMLNAREISGEALLPATDSLKGEIINAALTEKPERIEQGVRFVTDLDAQPGWARLECSVSGAILGQHIKVWINEADAGDLAIEVPDLGDPAYQPTPSGTLQYIGWRKATLYVPGSRLRDGENRIQFDGGHGEAPSPLALKDLILQLRYPQLSKTVPSIPTSQP